MKKILTFCFIIMLILTSFFCFFFYDKSDAFELALASDVTAIYDDLLVKIPNSTDISEMNSYLINWANDHNIQVSYDKYKNIIMSKKATYNYEDVGTTIIQCSIGQGIPEYQYQTIASALYILDKIEKHGLIRILFTSNIDNKMDGANSLNSKYLQGVNLINLTPADKTTFTIGSAGTSQYNFSKKLNWKKPTYPRAYELSIKNLNGGSSSVISEKYPNPIKIIGDFLAASKSKGILMELASFNGGQSSEEYPIDATAVILINDNDVNRFQKYFNSSASNFEDKYANIEENYTYTLTPISSPELVISMDDSTKILSLLYTMINGTYSKSEEGDIIATSNIGMICTKTGNLDVSICSRALDQSILNEMAATFSVICGLNDVEYKILDGFPIWVSNEESPLLIRLTSTFKNDYNKKIKAITSMDKTECAIFKQKNESLDVISMGVNFENDFTEIEALYTFLENLNLSDSIDE